MSNYGEPEAAGTGRVRAGPTRVVVRRHVRKRSGGRVCPVGANKGASQWSEEESELGTFRKRETIRAIDGDSVE
jgi:hypothetical protein